MKRAGFPLALAASAFLLGSVAAQAAPVSPAAPGAADAPIARVAGGCGFGEHRGPMGGCRLNRGPDGRLGPRARMRRMMTGAPRGCPPGMVRGPRGRCHP